jgi:hypothetical protein
MAIATQNTFDFSKLPEPKDIPATNDNIGEIDKMHFSVNSQEEKTPEPSLGLNHAQTLSGQIVMGAGKLNSSIVR